MEIVRLSTESKGLYPPPPTPIMEQNATLQCILLYAQALTTVQ